jgi:hypothetical protein
VKLNRCSVQGGPNAQRSESVLSIGAGESKACPNSRELANARYSGGSMSVQRSSSEVMMP